MTLIPSNYLIACKRVSRIITDVDDIICIENHMQKHSDTGYHSKEFYLPPYRCWDWYTLVKGTYRILVGMDSPDDDVSLSPTILLELPPIPISDINWDNVGQEHYFITDRTSIDDHTWILMLVVGKYWDMFPIVLPTVHDMIKILKETTS